MFGVSPATLTLIATSAISFAGVVVALWQARSAVSGARSAKASADAAITQALATVEQVNLLRKQIELDVASVNASQAPVFEISTYDNSDWGVLDDGPATRIFVSFRDGNQPPLHEWWNRQTATLRLTSGPAIHVVVRLAEPLRSNVIIQNTGPFRMARNATASFEFFVPYHMRGSEVEFILDSREVGGGQRSWTDVSAITA